MFSSSLLSQDVTVGLIQRSDFSSEVYTVIAPTASNLVYLINNCGQLVHQWDLPRTGAFGTYLRDDGMLVRVESQGTTFIAGGSAGRLSIYDWDSNTVWSKSFSEQGNFSIHHDIALLPNGNILAMLWDQIEYDDAVAAGRDSLGVSPQGVWSEMIYEIKPIGTEEAEIVWQWHAMDHIVQDINPLAYNFGAIHEHPERLDFNFDVNNDQNPDYYHFNGIDYHPDLDLIIVSCRNFSEVFILDHSTTTAEASGGTGGTLGKGGDLLYRAGNPYAYQHGLQEEKYFYGQHDPRWLMNDGDQIAAFSLYNNGIGRSDGFYSTIDEINPNFDILNATFDYDSDLGYTNARQEVVIDGSQFVHFFSARMSGAYKLENGNYMVCHANSGKIVEVDLGFNTLWHYINPVSAAGIATQGNSIGGNSVFKIESFDSSYKGFAGRDLTGGDPIELEPIPNDCIASSIHDQPAETLTYNSLWSDDLYLTSTEQINTLSIYSITGQQIETRNLRAAVNELQISVAHLPKGMYIVKVNNNQTLKCIKH